MYIMSEKIKINIDELYEKAINVFETEDNYSNRTIVAVLPETDSEGYMWGSIYLTDEVDLDPEEYPFFHIRGRFLNMKEANEKAYEYFETIK